ncbi:tryptophan 2,3-dioxygenase [Kitasatospora kifunensis]|uniref:Tryptophan 2,3-dioxygenase n=1 Tax=Kitasatospora kifunensis TaxID=58351 RepID=A0A7W7RAQ2_KITKI|nr:tryptophan 2,3-dioxygenase family protein [Kitasatospora kifunensis]MBB4928223.1 tryptophan 2,3-dioxygenase [Kitasatospora kifunensis]
MSTVSQCPYAVQEGDPDLTYLGPPPYESYVHASLLNSLQQPLSDAPGEMSFIVTTQVMELWFTLIVHEWRTAREALYEDRLPAALDALRRSLDAHRALNEAWRPIAKLTPAQFNGFRPVLGTASGFQSAMYRHMEFLLGDKSRSLIQAHRNHPEVYRELENSLAEPSLYDAVLAHLHRRGLPVPDAVLGRDHAKAYAFEADVEEAWRQIYAGPQDDPLVTLGELLTDIAESVQRWRGDHLFATRRAMGTKTGSGGSPGVAWLEKRSERRVFPEIWSARSHV